MVLTNPPFGKKSSVTIVNEAGDEEKQSLVVHRVDLPPPQLCKLAAVAFELRFARAVWASTSKCEPHRHYSSTSSSTSSPS